jgi:hypothetical protein
VIQVAHRSGKLHMLTISGHLTGRLGRLAYFRPLATICLRTPVEL